jgi:hypothetical protein
VKAACAALVALLLTVALAPPAGAQASGGAAPDSTSLASPETHPWVAVGEITLVNAIVWSFNRYIREGGGEGFKIGIGSWVESIENGFDWDPNNFSTNQWAHPYHGNLYFNAARSNGFDYWSSLGFAFGGSFQWEFFGETRHASFNDWINTSVGGAALGEMTHRLATVVRDNTATGKSRFWRELGGFAIDPVGAASRLFHGDLSREYANPQDRMPTLMSVQLRAGSRTAYEEHVGEADTTGAFFNFRFAYGDAFQESFRKPYEFFSAQLQVNTNDTKALGMANVTGMLARGPLAGGEHSEHVLAAFQHYDYVNNRAFELGGQSFSAGLLSRYGARDARYRVQTALHLSGVLLAATKSDYANQTARDYDYGPGLGASFSGTLTRDEVDVLRIGYNQFYIHAVNGNRADHFLSLFYLGASLPLGSTTAIGADYNLYLADRNYADFPDVEQRSPELQFHIQTKL